MKVLVAYESRGGTTKKAAEAIGAAVSVEGNDVTVKPIRDVSDNEVTAADVIFAGSWVKGFIVVGVGATPHALKAIASWPSLAGKRAASFCTYHVSPKGTLGQIDAALKSRGAAVVGERSFHHNEPEAGAAVFARDVLATVDV